MRYLNFKCKLIERYPDGTALISFYVSKKELNKIMQGNLDIQRIMREPEKNDLFYVRAIVSNRLLHE